MDGRASIGGVPGNDMSAYRLADTLMRLELGSL